MPSPELAGLVMSSRHITMLLSLSFSMCKMGFRNNARKLHGGHIIETAGVMKRVVMVVMISGEPGFSDRAGDWVSFMERVLAACSEKPAAPQSSPQPHLREPLKKNYLCA